jgi:hypothetical protein
VFTNDPTFSSPGCEITRAFPGWSGDRPPNPVRIIDSRTNELSRAAAVVSMILQREAEAIAGGGGDLGIVGPFAREDKGAVIIQTNDVCCLPDAEGKVDPQCMRSPDVIAACLANGTCDSCQSGGLVHLRPTVGNVLDDSFWKFVVAHEIGHAIQQKGMGSFKLDYNIGQPPGLVPPPKCACNHVSTSNSLHCLQSIEEPGAAQLEGFAQFFASRAFNRPSDGDCVFKYYKEFLNDACMPGVPPEACERDPHSGLIKSLPPVPINCLEPVRWRNNQGFDQTARPGDLVTDLGTEYDWMGFLFRGTTETPHYSTSDVFNVYRTACNGDCRGERITWEACNDCTSQIGLKEAARRYFTDVLHSGELALRFRDLGDLHGVSQSTQR